MGRKEALIFVIGAGAGMLLDMFVGAYDQEKLKSNAAYDFQRRYIENKVVSTFNREYSEFEPKPTAAGTTQRDVDQWVLYNELSIAYINGVMPTDPKYASKEMLKEAMVRGKKLRSNLEIELGVK
ncbi:MAG TPA: hypothetical protein VHA12_00955 [Candidatus Nanoarchaeia archaeon]|nr:hypothetical protein [Candidatus Nanoarchaeia archaeon]